MKKLLLPLSILLSCAAAQAQSILLPNGDFENWTSIPYDNPDNWDHSNLYTVPGYGFANVSKVAGTGSNYAIRLETKVSGTDTLAAYISNSDNPITGDGGVPYTFQAGDFHGAYRYNIIAGDTAWIIVKFKKDGTVISDNMYPVTGNEPNFTYFDFPLATLSQEPDSLIIAAVSGNVINGNPKAGSWLELDLLSFSDNIMWVSFQDGDFENWTAHSIDNPDGWMNYGLGEVSKTTDKYTGTYAMKLVSKDDGNGYIDEGAVALGVPSQMPGMPYTKTVDTLTGYYKYFTTGNDFGSVSFQVTTANGTPIGMGNNLMLPPAANYSYFEVPVLASTTPAILMVTISSSTYSSAVDGSTLYIDNLRLKNTPSNVGRLENDKEAFTVFPNPARDVLYIKPGKGTGNAATLHLYDMTGRLISKYELKSNLAGVAQIPVGGYAPGVYQYEIQSGEAVSRGKFVKE